MRLIALRLLPLMCLLVAACATHAPQLAKSTSPSNLKETPDMSSTQTTPAASAPLPQSTRTASELLQGLLELFRTSNSADDFSMEAVSKALRVPMQQFDANTFGAGATLTPEWWWSFEVDHSKKPDRSRLDFSFVVNRSLGLNAAPAATDICQMDFDQFTAQLEKLGFKRTPYYVEHGRHMNDDFRKGDMRIQVYLEGEANEPIEKISHKCVKMILVY